MALQHLLHEAVAVFNMDRSWLIAILKSLCNVALGFDKGTLLLQMGKNALVASMGTSGEMILKKRIGTLLSVWKLSKDLLSAVSNYL